MTALLPPGRLQHADADENALAVSEDLIIVTGGPSMPRTALAMNIRGKRCDEVARTVAVSFLKMAKEALFTRILCSPPKIKSHRLPMGTLWRDETRKVPSARDEFAHASIYTGDTPSLSLGEIVLRLLKVEAKSP